jgi:hypothetical protein
MGINNQSFSWEISLLSELRLGLGQNSSPYPRARTRVCPQVGEQRWRYQPNKLLALAAELEQQLLGLDEWAAVSWRHRLEAAERSSGRHDRCVDLIGITNFCVGLVLLANYIINL